MAKTREELQRELDANHVKLAQAQHQAERLENRIRYYAALERKQRTHRLITRGAAVESIWPSVRELSEKDFYSLMEQTLSLPEAQSVLLSFHPSHPPGCDPG